MKKEEIEYVIEFLRERNASKEAERIEEEALEEIKRYGSVKEAIRRGSYIGVEQLALIEWYGSNRYGDMLQNIADILQYVSILEGITTEMIEQGFLNKTGKAEKRIKEVLDRIEEYHPKKEIFEENKVDGLGTWISRVHWDPELKRVKDAESKREMMILVEIEEALVALSAAMTAFLQSRSAECVGKRVFMTAWKMVNMLTLSKMEEKAFRLVGEEFLESRWFSLLRAVTSIEWAKKMMDEKEGMVDSGFMFFTENMFLVKGNELEILKTVIKTKRKEEEYKRYRECNISYRDAEFYLDHGITPENAVLIRLGGHLTNVPSAEECLKHAKKKNYQN